MTPRRQQVARSGSRLFYALARHWLKVVIIALALYVGLPLAAPTLMRLGLEGPARLIYTIYTPLCHQLAFRSFFLFGAQPVYPLEAAGVQGVGTFEDYALQDPSYLLEFSRYREEFAANDAVRDPDRTAHMQVGRFYVGNSQMGFKVALCERDMAIYGALLAGALIFARVRRWLRPAPLWLYLLLGIGPIALDGGSQLLSDPQLNLWPLRESQPLFRIMTGALFGLMNMWLAFPYIEAAMREAQQDAEARAALAGDPEALHARTRARISAWAEGDPAAPEEQVDR